MTDTTRCPIRFGWAASREIIVTCDLEDGHDGAHAGDWHHDLNEIQPVTRITWVTDDRRSFVGDWVRCPELQAQCVLPAGHPGNHAA